MNSESFDKSLTITLTRKQTKEVKAVPGQYHFLPSNVNFDFLDLYFHQFYEIKFRVVRFPVSDNTFECVVTNLPSEDFALEDIKKLYGMRWGIETSFRELKYSIGLTNFHSKKADYIKQEIWARLILYNFCEAIISHTVIKQSCRMRISNLHTSNWPKTIYGQVDRMVEEYKLEKKRVYRLETLKNIDLEPDLLNDYFSSS